jgi:hypothetical protein
MLPFLSSFFGRFSVIIFFLKPERLGSRGSAGALFWRPMAGLFLVKSVDFWRI